MLKVYNRLFYGHDEMEGITIFDLALFVGIACTVLGLVIAKIN